jgi:DNA segregation ATPase FtsK/SpoIIIE-like protein
MPEASQEIMESTEQHPTSTPSSKRSKKFAKERPKSADGSAQPTVGTPLLCDSLSIPNKQRLQIGFVGMAFVLPFISLSLIYPEWTGHIGTRLSLGLFSFLGQGALLVPPVTLYLILSCSGFRPLKRTQPIFLAPLFLCLVQLTERWSGTGGWLGTLLDRAFLAALGPGGAWLITVTLLTLVTAGFIPKLKNNIAQTISLLAEHLHEAQLRLRAWWQKTPNHKAPEESVTTHFTNHHNDQRGSTQIGDSPMANPIPSLSIEERGYLSGDTVTIALDRQEPLEQLILPKPSPTEPLLNCDPNATLIEHILPKPPEPPRLKNPETAKLCMDDTSNIVRFADSAEIEESLEIQRPKLTNSDEAQAAVPRARTFELPPLVLLDEIPYAARQAPTEDKSKQLLDALDAFGVKAKLLQIVRGPAVTRYELQPARGVKVSKFTSLTNDIALALASTAVRIEAPIPGKSAIGIEIPNKYTDLVVLKDILRDSIFTESKGLTVALGKDLSGRPVVTDLQKMPHLLVAGTTGSGKSVCVNGLIISLLYRFTPDQLQLMMVDPKQVELSVYEDIPHLVGFSDTGKGEIIVDPKKAAQALHQVVGLMEERYTLFAENKVRNLAEYNHKFDEEPLPWFVVIIDELADLMMVASKSVETSICRIAQKARAAGIHLVLATQRPSADVITGLIKVNIPSRAAFAVSSQVDSRVILDSGGAEHLLGKGDMLFLPVDASDPKRVQGCYVGNEEIARVVEFWKGQGHPDNRIEFDFQADVLAEEEETDDQDSDDALLEQALRVTLNRKQASASMLQTELKVGYARARRLLMAMEKRGWVGPAEGSKPRKILFSGSLPDTGSEQS